MDVEDPFGEGAQEHRRDDAHEACKAHEADFVAAQFLDQAGVVVLAPRVRAMRKGHGGYVRFLGACERARARNVADDRRHLRWNPPGGARVEDRLQVRSGTGDEHAEAHHARKTTSGSASPADSSTVPISQARWPRRPSSARTPSTSSRRTTAHMPMPQLKVRSISSSSIPPSCWM